MVTRQYGRRRRRDGLRPLLREPCQPCVRFLIDVVSGQIIVRLAPVLKVALEPGFAGLLLMVRIRQA